jgi:hypothetical protein
VPQQEEAKVSLADLDQALGADAVYGDGIEKACPTKR